MLSVRTAAVQLFVIMYNRGSHSGIPAYAPVVLLSEASASRTHKVARGPPAVTPHRVRFGPFCHAAGRLPPHTVIRFRNSLFT